MDMFIYLRDAKEVLQDQLADSDALTIFMWMQSQDSAGVDGYYEYCEINYDSPNEQLNFVTHDASYKIDEPSGAADLFPDNLVFG